MNTPHQFWDDRYNAPEYTYGTQPNLYFKQQLDALKQPGRLLLLAEGEGRNAVYAAEKGWQVTAVDFSEKGRDKALSLASDRNVKIDYQLVSVQEFDFKAHGPWDAIGLIYGHFPSHLRTALHQKCVDALKPDGWIILEAFNPGQLLHTSGGPKDLDLLYSKEMLEADFKGVSFQDAVETTILLEEGTGHHGLGAVVRLLCQKIA